VIDGGLAFRRSPQIEEADVTCIFCGIVVSNRILLDWHWTADEECGLAAKMAGLV